MKKTTIALSLTGWAVALACNAPPKGDDIPDPGVGETGDDTAAPDSSDGGGSGDPSDGDDSAPDGDAGGDDSGSFIIEPDVPAGECDVWSQDCPEGEKCMPWANDGGGSWNALKCTALDANPKAPGDACTVEGTGVSGIDDCDIGSMCWDVDVETNQGYCVEFCAGDQSSGGSCDDPDTTCAIYNDGVLPLCLAVCDPLLQGCENEDVCVPKPGGESFVCVLDASGPDMGAFADACEFVNVCDAGLFCANADTVPNCTTSVGCCSEYCDITDADPAASCSGRAEGQDCVPWFEDGQAPPGLEHVGACAIPS